MAGSWTDPRLRLALARLKLNQLIVRRLRLFITLFVIKRLNISKYRFGTRQKTKNQIL